MRHPSTPTKDFPPCYMSEVRGDWKMMKGPS